MYWFIKILGLIYNIYILDNVMSTWFVIFCSWLYICDNILNMKLKNNMSNGVKTLDLYYDLD
jgi:hypothetical protein